MSGPVKMSELIAAYGDDNVQFQNLDHCATHLNMNNGVTKITFYTEQPINFKDGTEKFGLILWMDRKRVTEIMADIKLRRTDQ